MKRLYFIPFALVLFLIVPASAWVQFGEQITTPYSSDQTGPMTTPLWSINNLTLMTSSSITRFTFEFNGQQMSGGTSGSWVAYITDITFGGDHGTAYCDWTSDTVGTWGTINIDCRVDHWHAITENSATGQVQFVQYNSTGLNVAYNYTDTSYMFNNASHPFGFVGGTNVPTGYSFAGGTFTMYTGNEVNPPTASFTCTPTSQFPDTDVVCTDTSTNSPTDWYWSIDAEAMGIDGWQTSTSQNFTWQSAFPGLYSVNLKVNNSAGNDWENKTNYVSISENATPNNCNIPVVSGLIRSWAQCVDSQTSGAIAGCDLSLYDLEGGAWSNITDRFDGTWCIDTYPGHHINAYGWADDYTPSPTSRLNLNANAYVVYELLMHPGYVPPAATGKVWLYVIVNDADTGASLSDVHVSISGSGQTTKSDVTDSTGSVHIQWVNASTAYVTASKGGYTSGSKTVTTSDYGPDTVRIELHKGTVSPTATATTGPGGTVPTTAGPWGTPGPYGTMPSGYTNAQGQMAMDYLAANGLMLVQLCVLVTICALLGFKFGK